VRVYLLSGFLVAASAVSTHASEVASEIWLSDVGTVGSGVAQGVPNLKLRDGANTIYIWGRPQEDETLQNLSLNIRSTNDVVLDFTEVIMDNPFLTTNPVGLEVSRFTVVVDTPQGSVTPNVDPDSLVNFQGVIFLSIRPTAGMGPVATDFDPLYDAVADAFRIATVNFNVVGNRGITTELFLQIGPNGANLLSKSSNETPIVFGDPNDPPLNANTEREVDSATPDAIIRVVPEPSSIWLFALALLAIAVLGRIAAARSRNSLGVGGRTIS